MKLLSLCSGIFGVLGFIRCDPPLIEGSTCTFGICTQIYDCPGTYSSVLKNGYHKLQRCGFSGSIEVVCCPLQSRQITFPRASEAACQKYKKNNFPQQLDFQIAGGEDAKAGQYPFMASLAIYLESEKLYKFICGGTLISEKYILTAAHCLFNQYAANVAIATLGTVKIRTSFTEINETVDFKVEASGVYPNYDRHKKLNDIGWIKLEKKVKFRPELKPACLYSNISYPADFVILGWGEMNNFANDSKNILQQAFVSLYSSEKCQKKFDQFNEVAGNHLCARDDNSDTCLGDSGGPLLERHAEIATIVGITAFGESGRCEGGSPSVYTGISKYLTWIECIVWNENSSIYEN